MTVQDHRYHRPAPGVDLQGRLSPFWRWLSELVWRLEHGFERARADAATAATTAAAPDRDAALHALAAARDSIDPAAATALEQLAYVTTARSA